MVDDEIRFAASLAKRRLQVELPDRRARGLPAAPRDQRVLADLLECPLRRDRAEASGTFGPSAPSRVCTSDDSALPYVSAFGWATACAPMVSRIVSAGSAKSTHCSPSMVRSPGRAVPPKLR